MSSTPSLAEAYARCESITRTQAANFYYGIRLLPSDRRRAMCAAYAFARRVDDIGDGGLAREQKLHLLDQAAGALAELERPGAGVGASADAVLVALHDAHTRFALPPGALGALIEGVRMDVNGVAYESFEELVLYCRRVAGAIGRVCLAIFGTRKPRSAAGPDAEALADDLGVALQLTNILRDVREDAENGRVYLPAEDLRRFGLIAAREPAEASALLAKIQSGDRRRASGATLAPDSSALEALVRFQAERAQQWFDRGIYHRLLERIEADPGRALSERASLPASEKLWVAVRSMLGGSA
jgi:phytoene synthase